MVLDVARRLLEGLPAADTGEVVAPRVAVTAAVVVAVVGVLVRGRPDGVVVDILGHGLMGVRVRGWRGWSLGGQHGAVVGIQRTQHRGNATMWSGRFQRGEAGIQVKCLTGKTFFFSRSRFSSLSLRHCGSSLVRE